MRRETGNRMLVGNIRERRARELNGVAGSNRGRSRWRSFNNAGIIAEREEEEEGIGGMGVLFDALARYGWGVLMDRVQGLTYTRAQMYQPNKFNIGHQAQIVNGYLSDGYSTTAAKWVKELKIRVSFETNARRYLLEMMINESADSLGLGVFGRRIRMEDKLRWF
ncbi:hypothetical protein BVC80_1823g14 [Macleaya cordata]|uniref:Uncharacterized protein n=1 Tax=Macleaya cordata TaxID=56857 RepID=A0A200QZX9_MACCD|nr:hypothetical protein BVC80_1823g14 [Macleaya cordata]